MVGGNNWPDLHPPSLGDFRPHLGVSVIVPHYQAPEPLSLTLAALERQTYPHRLFEVIVVDDGSPDALKPQPTGRKRVRILHQERDGFGLARVRNLGARSARFPILLFLDCDMIPDERWIAAHARWHHVASDVLTLGFRSHVDTDGINAALIRQHPDAIESLWTDRPQARPEWIDLHMVRTRDLTSGDDDLFRVVTGGNLGVGQRFFEEVGGFDASFRRWGLEDIEFGYRAYTRGAILVPERAGFCWHQGEGAAPSGPERASLSIQRAKVANLIPHPEFREASRGRTYDVPTFVITVNSTDQRAGAVRMTVESLLSSEVTDMVVWVIDRPDDQDFQALKELLAPDQRVFFGPAEQALIKFPVVAFHLRIDPAPDWGARILRRIEEALGEADAVIGQTAGGSAFRAVRSRLAHQAARTGQPLELLGEVRVIGPETGPSRSRRTVRRPPSRFSRGVSTLAQVRRPAELVKVVRWLATATVRHAIHRIRAAFPPAARNSDKPHGSHRPSPAMYPLGVEIAVAGDRSAAVLASSGRVVASDGVDRWADLVVADAPGTATGPRPVLCLSDVPPTMRVPAFDPLAVNPIGWARDTDRRVGALGDVQQLPNGVAADVTVDQERVEPLTRVHHLEDVAAFHADANARAATLVRLAASGVVIHLSDEDRALRDYLGADLYTLMSDSRIRRSDLHLRELLSIRMRRAALREHSLRARARQLAGHVGIPNYAGLPEVSIVLASRRPEMVAKSMRMAEAQTYPRLELVVAVHGDGPPSDRDLPDIRIPTRIVRAPAHEGLGQVLNRACLAAGGKLITKMDDDDLYSTEHVWDLVLAHEYSGANLVAKAAEFVYLADSDQTIHRMVGGGDVVTADPTIAGGALILSRHDLDEVGGWRRIPASVDQALRRDVEASGGKVHRTHGFGYLLVRHGQGHTWEVSDQYFLGQAQDRRPGMDMAFADVG